MNVRRIGRGELEVSAVRVRDPSESSRFRNLLHSLERKALSSVIAGSIAISTFAGAKTAFAASAVPQQYQNYVQVIADPNTDVGNQLSNDVNNLLGSSNGLYADLGGESVVINSASSKPITNVSNQNITQTEFNNWTSIIMNDIPVYLSAPYISSGGNIPASVQNQENTVSANANNIIGSAAASSYYQAEQKVTEAIYGSNLVSSDTSTQSGSESTSPTPSTSQSTSNESSSTASGTNSSSGQELQPQVSTSKYIASITLNALPSSENVGAVVTFAGTVYGMDAKPFPNAPVQIVNTNDPSGPETLASGSTNSNGTFSIQIDMRNARTYVIVAQTYNGTNNLNDINSGPSQIVVNPVFIATPKITIGEDAQTNNDTNIAITGSGFTPNGNVNIEWNNITVLSTIANGQGNFSLQTTASQIIKASNGQLGSNVGINTSIDAIDVTSGKASASIPIYLYTKSQSQPAQQTTNPDTQSSNGGNAGSQGAGIQSSGGSSSESGQSGAVTGQGNNTNTVQTPTVYVMNADSSKFSGVLGSISNPYPGWNGWQGQGYYFFANKSLESANIISSTSDAQLYFIAMGGSEAQSPWPQISGLPQKVNYQLVQNKSQTALTGNDGSGSSQTNNGGSGNAAPPSSLGNAGSSSTSTTDTKSQGTYASGVSSGSQNSGSNGITVNIPGPGSGQVGGNSSYIPTTTITNPQTNVSGPTVTEVFKDLKRAYEKFTGTVFPTSMTSNTTEAANEYIAMLMAQPISNPALLIDGWCSAMTGVPSGYDVEMAGIGVGTEYQGYNETTTLGPSKYTIGATGNTLTIGGGVSGSLISVKATIIPCILTVSASVGNWDLSETISQNLSRENILNSEGSITASAADLNIQGYVPGTGGYQYNIGLGYINANNNGVSGSMVTTTSKTPTSTSTTNIYFNGSESTSTSSAAEGTGTKSDPYQPNLDDTITWRGNGYYNLTANLPSVYGISPGVYKINKTFAEAYNSWVNSS